MQELQSVLWTKGVMLTPQHLQTQDRFLEDQLHFRMAALTVHPWGLARLEIERDALAGGLFSVSSAAGLFPDGLPFAFPETDTAPEPKPVEEQWEPERESMLLYLAVPDHRVGGHNISHGKEGNGSTRYLAEVVLRPDENTGRSEKPIQVARKNLMFLTEAESLDGKSVLPIARVVRGESGELRLDPDFVPPLVDISASDHLLSLLRRSVEMLAAKSSSLSGMRRARKQGLADFGIADVANFWLLYTVNSHLPVLRHLYETRKGHPVEAYRALLTLAGALMTFAPEAHPRDLPTYRHGDLTGCFNELDRMVRTLLETVVPASHASLPLEPVEPSIFATAIDQDRYLDAPEWYLAMEVEGIERRELARRAPQLVKVSAAGRIEELVKHALPGLPLQHVPNPPRKLPVKLDYEYFRVDQSGEDWNKIRRSRNLAVYVPSDLPDPTLELVVVLPSRDR
jgi:type VI secretion system protein ImpJ